MIKVMFFLLMVETSPDAVQMDKSWLYGPFPTQKACEEAGEKALIHYDPSLSNVPGGATANGFVCMKGGGFLRDRPAQQEKTK